MNIQSAIFNPYTRNSYQSGQALERTATVQNGAPAFSAKETGTYGQPVQETSPSSDQAHPQGQTSEQTDTQNEESAGQSSVSDSSQLTDAELRLVEELKQIDAAVRRHEMAHMAAGGAYITSGANFTYQQGPDGLNYAIGGEVSIDTSPIPGDPKATLRKMRQIRSAALAPAAPSTQDMKVAASASAQAVEAMSEITMLQAKEQAEQRETQAFGNTRQEASDAYARMDELPEEDTATFKLAV